MSLDYMKVYTPWNQALKIPILKYKCIPCLFGGLLTCNSTSNIAHVKPTHLAGNDFYVLH